MDEIALAHRRNCFWAPDYSYLSFLKPIAGRFLAFGPSVSLTAYDSADQSLAANANTWMSFNLNTIRAGTWQQPQVNQAIVVENLISSLQCRDATGNLQITSFQVATDEICYAPMSFGGAMPFNMPKTTSFYFICVGIQPIPLLLRRPGSPQASGPQANFSVINTSATVAALYRRYLGITFRIVDNVDFSSGPAIPGAGSA